MKSPATPDWNDPIEEVSWEHDGQWLTAIMRTDRQVGIFTENGEQLWEFTWAGRRGDTDGFITACEEAVG